MSWSYNPNIAVTTLVWANPRSLATTYGITFVFFSSAYLDVSVQRVCPLSGNASSMHWVAPFGYLRINSCVPIPVAFRSLSRPSSPLRAKASPIRPYFAYCTNTLIKMCRFFYLSNDKQVKNAFYFLLFSYLNMSMNFYAESTSASCGE